MSGATVASQDSSGVSCSDQQLAYEGSVIASAGVIASSIYRGMKKPTRECWQTEGCMDMATVQRATAAACGTVEGELNREVRAYLRWLELHTQRIVKTSWGAIEAVANTLLAMETATEHALQLAASQGIKRDLYFCQWENGELVIYRKCK